MSYTRRKPWSSEPYDELSEEQRSVRQKTFYFSLLVIFVFGLLTLQLARMQLVDGDEYLLRADTNRLRLETILPARGQIYDRNGVVLVENVAGFSAAVVAADVPQDRREEIARALQRLTGEPADRIIEVIESRIASNDPFSPAVIRENLSQEVAFALRENLADLPGVRVIVEPQREYLEGELMAHIIGFMGPVYEEDYEELAPEGYLLNDRVGRTGVEAVYESNLRGSPGTRAIETDASGREIRLIDSVPAMSGANLVLSIDLDLQRAVTNILRESMGDSLNASAIVMDVHTGELLALVSLPSYDSNFFSGEIDQRVLNELYEDPAKPMLNHALSEMYPPGSTFKVITGLAALQEGVANENTQITSFGGITVQSEIDPSVLYRFPDWHPGLGTMDFYRGLAMSSNVYFYYLAGGYAEGGITLFSGLGAQRLSEWAENFGLGRQTGVDLPGETTGLVPNPAWKQDVLEEDWLLGDSYNFGIGQGYMAATPIQMIRVAAAVANGGYLVTPHVGRELRVGSGSGEAVPLDRDDTRQYLGIDPRNIEIMQEAMRQSVDIGGAYTAQVRNVTVAGKTGTAEFDERRPDGSYKEHGWFTGFAPFDDPEVAIIVFHERGNGAGTAAPTAARILDYYFNQHNLAQENAP